MTTWSEGAEPQGALLRWRAMGEGPPLVLLHKLGGWIAEWTTMAHALGGRRVIALDLPGHGGGGGPAPYIQGAEDSAARVLATLDVLRVEQFALGGASLGGSIAVAVAAMAPERVQGLALISVALTGPATLEQMRQNDLKGDGLLYGPGDAPVDRSVEQTAAQFGLTDPRLSQDMNESRRAAGPWVRASWRGANLADTRGRLPLISAPTLLLYGQRGGAGYAASEKTGLILLRDARAQHLAEASAFAHQDQPERTAAAISGFLEPAS